MLRSYELSLPKILRVMRLSELKTGEKGVIVKVLGHGGFRKRIVEMGFIKGKTVEVLLNAPLKDPINVAPSMLPWSEIRTVARLLCLILRPVLMSM